MPQDELWRASARCTGYRCTLDLDVLDEGSDVFMFRPTWSKEPSVGRTGGIVLPVPTFMRGHLPEIFKAGHDATLGGDPRFASLAVRSAVRRVLEGFEAGSLH